MRILVLEELAGDVALRAQSAGLRDERFANAEPCADDWRIRQVDPARPAGSRPGARPEGGRARAPTSRWSTSGPPTPMHWMREEARTRLRRRAARVGATSSPAPARRSRRWCWPRRPLAAASTWCWPAPRASRAPAASSACSLAAHLGVPCVTQACAIEPAGEAGPGRARDHARARRRVPRARRRHAARRRDGRPGGRAAGARCRVARSAPLADGGDPRLGPRTARRAARASCRPRHGPLRAGDAARAAPAAASRIAAPDQSAPAFDRILQLVAGTVQRRAGQVVHGTPDEIAAEIVATLSREGWLDHLRADAAAGPARCSRRPRRRPQGDPAPLPAARPGAADRGGGRARTRSATCRWRCSAWTAASARLLQMTAGGVRSTSSPPVSAWKPSSVVRLCEYFRSRGLLDVELGSGASEPTPSVTVVVPVKDRAADLDDCLASLDAPRLPARAARGDRGRRRLVRRPRWPSPPVHSCTVLVNERTRGSVVLPQPGRLAGVRPTSSPSPTATASSTAGGYGSWSLPSRGPASPRSADGRELLRDVAPGPLRADGVVAGHGPAPACVPRRRWTPSTCRPATCWCAATLYLAAGGLREDLHVGEDVDLCWRLRARGDVLVYAPRRTGAAQAPQSLARDAAPAGGVRHLGGDALHPPPGQAQAAAGAVVAGAVARRRARRPAAAEPAARAGWPCCRGPPTLRGGCSTCAARV